MALGLLGSALAGGGEAIQDNAMDRIKKKRDEALLKLKEDATIRAEEREGKRAAASTAAEWAREDQQRQQDREWETSDAKREHEQALQLQKLRNQRGYGSGGGPTANQREAQWLVEQGIAPDLKSAWPMVSARADQGDESLDYVNNRIEELEGTLNDPDAMMSLVGGDADESDIDEQIEKRTRALREELRFFRGKRDELASNRYGIRSPGLLSQENDDGKGSGRGGQDGPPREQGGSSDDVVTNVLNSVLR